MLKTIQTALSSIVQLVIAFYLAYGFSDVFLKAFLPASWTIPGIIIAAVGFFLLLRWLRMEEAPSNAVTDDFEISSNRYYLNLIPRKVALANTTSIRERVCANPNGSRAAGERRESRGSCTIPHTTPRTAHLNAQWR